VGLLVGVLAGLVLNVNVSFEFSRYSAVAILAALDSVLGAVRAELDGVYDNRIFISGFLTNATPSCWCSSATGQLDPTAASST
jgi:small basic protein